MQLSENFTLREFTRSQTASRQGIENRPPENTIPAVRALVEHVLQPVRLHFGKAVTITSGFRSKALKNCPRCNRWAKP